jgi:CheY-like chemotaxis protein
MTQRNRITEKKFWNVLEEKRGGMMKIILVVNDHEAQAWLLAHTILRERRYNTLFAGGCSEALYFVQHIIPHLFIFDSRASPDKGLECYDSLPAMASLKSIKKFWMCLALPYRLIFE